MKKKMKQANNGLWLLLLFVAGLQTGCTGDSNSDIAPNDNEIILKADVWQMMEGTRATFYDASSLASGGSFTAAAYVAESTTPYINPTQVNWNSTTSKWEFADGKHYWPASGSLDFFAYMPATPPSYITGPTYTTARSPQFTCTLPMTYESAYTDEESVAHDASGQTDDVQEFVWGMAVGQNKAGQGETGVTMTFRHPFARIKFMLSAEHPDITINSITFKGLKSGGTCTFDISNSTSTWTSLTPSDNTTDFVMTLHGTEAEFTKNTESATPARPIGPEIIMVPQTFAGDIEVNATWIDWGEPYSHNISTTISSQTWAAGTSYTYTFTITETDLRVDTEKFTEQW